MLKQKTKILAAIFSAFLLLSPVAVTHAAGLVPCGGYNTGYGATNTKPCTICDMFYLAGRIINLLISLAGLYAAIQIIISGFYLTISQGNQSAVEKHRGHIINAIIGLVLVLAAFLIVNTVVNTLLLGSSNNKLNLSNPSTYLGISKNYSCTQ